MENKETQSVELKKLFEEFKGVNDRKDEEIKTMGSELAETKEYMEKLQAKMDEVEVKMARPAVDAGAQVDKDKEIKSEAYDTFCRKGFEALTTEQKTMIASDNTTGGYLISDDIVTNELIKNIVEFSPIRANAYVRSTSKNAVKMRKQTGVITGGTWVSEIGARPDDGNMTYGMIEVPVHELAGYVDISNQDLDDSDFNLQAELNQDISEQFGVTEGASFVSGDAVGKPEGILTNSEIASINGGHASELQADALLDLYYEIKTGYLSGAKFLMNRQTLKAVRKLKDGNGNYLWLPGLDMGEKPTILGHSYIDAVDMPDIAADSYPIAFGDFKRGYMVVDRAGITVLRDPYTQATTGVTRFHIKKRVGGQTRKPEAIKKMKISV
jgi:HK97 family phage major capsid protein